MTTVSRNFVVCECEDCKVAPRPEVMAEIQGLSLVIRQRRHGQSHEVTIDLTDTGFACKTMRVPNL